MTTQGAYLASLMLACTIATATHAGGRQPDSSFLTSANATQPDLWEPVHLAQADMADAQASGEPAEGEALSAQCAAFAKDIDADLGEVLRAGCEPTLAQMSALMDNPLGNVAMFFNQFDLYRMEDQNADRKENQWMYTGIFAVPQAAQ